MARVEKRRLKDGTTRYKAIIRRKGVPLKTKTFATRKQALRWATRLENKIFEGIVHPGAALMVITGPMLVLTDPEFYVRAHWGHAKMLLVVFMLGLDCRIYFGRRPFSPGKSRCNGVNVLACAQVWPRFFWVS